jgi:cell division protein FtsQ
VTLASVPIGASASGRSSVGDGEHRRVAGERRPRANARAEVLPFPGEPRPRQSLGRFVPSTRSILVGVALLAMAAGAYVLAREMSFFALRTIEVEGAPAPLAERVRVALEPLVGVSLVKFDQQDANRRLAPIAEIAAARYDRDFPNTLRVSVRVEEPVAVLRQGSSAWLVSASARILRGIDARPYPPLPRIWIPRSVDTTVGGTLSGPQARAVRSVSPLERIRFPVDVRSVRASDDELTFVLASGPEIRLGDAGDLALKLAVARRLLPRVPDASYIDVSVPERSVAGYPTPATDSQVQG